MRTTCAAALPAGIAWGLSGSCEPMRAIILNAGRGSRMAAHTDEMPKCLIQNDGRTILDEQLHALAQAGCDSATVIGGYRIDKVAAHLRRAEPPLRVDLRLNPFWSVSGSVGSVWAARDLLDEPFCLVNGDTVFHGTALTPITGARAAVSLLVEAITTPTLDDMLVNVQAGLVLNVSKTLSAAIATHRSLGVIAAGRGSEYAAALAAVIGSGDGINSYHHDVVDVLAARGGVTAVEHRGSPWVEVDRPEDLEVWRANAAHFA